MKLDFEKMCLQEFVRRLEIEIKKKSESGKSPHQIVFCKVVEQFGYEDIGVLFIFLMNVLILKQGEWFLIPANVLHCYIEGELVEIMVNSDNVIRGGLTPKLKDTKTLL